MKNSNVCKIVLVCSYLILYSSLVNSQTNFFDSTGIVTSSSDYDYKNPVFIPDENYFTTTTLFVYERHSQNGSDIIVRNVTYQGYGDEVNLTGSLNGMNINPSISGGMIVWQSNSNGNWGLYYSLYENSIWSPPVLIDSLVDNSVSPYVYHNNTAPIQFNFYFLAYKQAGDIRFKRYRTSLGVWDADTTFEQSDTNEIHSINILRNSAGPGYGVAYLKNYSDNVSRINVILFNTSGSNTVNWGQQTEYMFSNTVKNLKVTNTFGEFLIYDYDTLGASHCVMNSLGGQNTRYVLTKSLNGNHSFGSGSTMGFITDYFYITAFACVTYLNDSTFMTFMHSFDSFNPNPFNKKIKIGEGEISFRKSVSQPVFQDNYYKIRCVWEQEINGKTALFESYMIDFINSIESETLLPAEFWLHQNYPNPFNPVTRIEFAIPEQSHVKLSVYDITGRQVAVIVNQEMSSGRYTFDFIGRDLSSGVYFYKLEAGEFREIKRMVLIK